jgi:hypothetical protein
MRAQHRPPFGCLIYPDGEVAITGHGAAACDEMNERAGVQPVPDRLLPL